MKERIQVGKVYPEGNLSGQKGHRVCIEAEPTTYLIVDGKPQEYNLQTKKLTPPSLPSQ